MKEDKQKKWEIEKQPFEKGLRIEGVRFGFEPARLPLENLNRQSFARNPVTEVYIFVPGNVLRIHWGENSIGDPEKPWVLTNARTGYRRQMIWPDEFQQVIQPGLYWHLPTESVLVIRLVCVKGSLSEPPSFFEGMAESEIRKQFADLLELVPEDRIWRSKEFLPQNLQPALDAGIP